MFLASASVAFKFVFVLSALFILPSKLLLAVAALLILVPRFDSKLLPSVIFDDIFSESESSSVFNDSAFTFVSFRLLSLSSELDIVFSNSDC